MHRDLRQATAEEFYTAINQSMFDDDRRCFLSDYSLSDHENMEHTILMKNDHAGFAIKEGDIVSVFSSRHNPVRRSLDTMMPYAISLGGVKLDCLGEVLRRKYTKYGFVAVAAVQFLDEHAPRNWDYDKFGRPAVYFMVQRQKALLDSYSSAGDVPHLTYDDAYEYREGSLKGGS